MDIIIGNESVRASIQSLGAMTTLVFNPGTPRQFSPSYTAKWEGFPELALLDSLRGDFLCVPFGAAPALAEDLPEAWREGFAGPSEWVHGPSANLEWSASEVGEDYARLFLEYAPDSPIEKVERRVTCLEGGVEFLDSILVRSDCCLPLGLHPIFSLPEAEGGARIELPECDSLWAFPADSGTSVLDRGAVFHDATRAPRADGGTLDLTRLPLKDEVDEIVLLAAPKKGRVALFNEAEGYRVALEWDTEVLDHAMLWISNYGRKGAPWCGRNLCLGIEAITSAFDFGTGVSGAPNPLSDAGFRTAVELHAGQIYEIRHRITGEAL